MEEKKQTIEKNPHIYRPGYKKAEAEEVLGWFRERMERLPRSLQLNEATSTKNLPRTVEALMSVVKSRENMLDVTFSSYMSHLLLIRQRLMEQGME